MTIHVYFVAYETVTREGIQMQVPAGLYDAGNSRHGWSVIGATTRGTECVLVSRNPLTLRSFMEVGRLTTTADLDRVLTNTERNAVNTRMGTTLTAGATVNTAVFTVAGLSGNRLYVGADGLAWIGRNPSAIVEPA